MLQDGFNQCGTKPMRHSDASCREKRTFETDNEERFVVEKFEEGFEGEKRIYAISSYF